ncbi:hypothetical protein GCM10011444_08750 [Winogradskyella haliclonae]|uniref:Uncharacterized protein n=1 Tax=Winogradskyella haliclonae TaxID=2048558 RepID=A0ABQ2BXF6_9FLAO|nr:hypothetical protein GCM10011444_08750 [Winogradskyella haliclonae]
MIKKIVGYTLVILGLLCFLIVGGGSMRFRNRTINLHNSLTENIVAIVLILSIPVVGYFLMKFGFKILEKNKE